MIFQLDTTQQNKLNKWFKIKDLTKCGTISDRFTYCFTPTSLGTIVTVQDQLDKTEIDLTDYEEW